MTLRIVCVVAAVAACGGGKPPVNEPAPGEQHETTPPAAPLPDAGAASATPPVGEIARPEPPVAGTFIELKNAGTTPLSFLVTKGWGMAVFAYTGKPPKAKPVTLFEAACSASCDAPEEAICPECPEPKDKKEEQAMARNETAAPGNSLKVPWDGKILVFAKTQGKKKCQCWTKVEPPADSYTIKACGLRPPKIVGKSSLPVCAETVVTLGPGATSPPPIVLSFPK